MFSPAHTAGKKGVQVRDAIDLKRMMMTVVIAMIPCLIWGIFNVGYQHQIATGSLTEGGFAAFSIGIISYLEPVGYYRSYWYPTLLGGCRGHSGRY